MKNYRKKRASKKQSAQQAYEMNMMEAWTKVQSAIKDGSIKVGYPKGIVTLSGSATLAIAKAVGVIGDCRYSTLWVAAKRHYEIPRMKWDAAKQTAKADETPATTPKESEKWSRRSSKYRWTDELVALVKAYKRFRPKDDEQTVCLRPGYDYFMSDAEFKAAQRGNWALWNAADKLWQYCYAKKWSISEVIAAYDAKVKADKTPKESKPTEKPVEKPADALEVLRDEFMKFHQAFAAQAASSKKNRSHRLANIG